MTVKKEVAVYDPYNNYLSNCTWKRALGLVDSGKAIRLNASSIRLVQTKRQRIKQKHSIIDESNRICYICNSFIPEEETATIDHMIPKSRDRRADVYTNMRCCCSRCNNDKGNMTLSEYVKHIFNHREDYDYITDKHLLYLKHFAQHFESEFYSNIRNSNQKQSSYKRRKHK